jgi:hypothetical protein
MRYELEVKSRTFELIFYILILAFPLLFSKSGFIDNKSYQFNHLSYIVETCIIAVWLAAYYLKLRHLILKYFEILKRKDSLDRDVEDVYGIPCQ